MFTEIHLGNFKRFQRCTIPLRPVNIVVGPNNSGKSSIISALRLVVQTLDSYDDQVPLLLNGPLGDFGTFKDVVYQNHRGRPLEIGFAVELPDLHDIATSDSQITKVNVDVVFKYNTAEREIYAESIVIKADGDHLISLRYSKETRRHNVEKLGRTQIPPSLKSVLSREFRVRHFIPVPLSARLGVYESREGKESPYKTFLSALSKTPDIEVPRLLTRLANRLTRVIASTDYLGPLRTPPARTYLFSGERRNRIGVAGENMPSLLATSDGRKSRSRPAGQSLTARINQWLQRAELAKSAVLAPISDRHFELRVSNFFTGENQNIADVGYGHSQVLPFLAGGYALTPGAAYLAEQPELHLHPRAQAGLADFLVDLYADGIQTIIETHSEHLILRLQQHIARGSIDASDVRIFYVHNDTERARRPSPASGCSEVLVIDLNDSGQFKTAWPNGFFPEKLAEARELARARLSHAEL